MRKVQIEPSQISNIEVTKKKKNVTKKNIVATKTNIEATKKQIMYQR